VTSCLGLRGEIGLSSDDAELKVGVLSAFSILNLKQNQSIQDPAFQNKCQGKFGTAQSKILNLEYDSTTLVINLKSLYVTNK
jgi:hypothetical protein